MDSLEHILESKNYSETLAFLLLAPPRAYTAKELAKRLHHSEKTVQQTLRGLTTVSMVKVFRKNTQSFYIVNPRHKLLPEIRQSLVKSQKPFEDELFAAIKKLGEIKGAFLSGVFTGQPQLPVDILLVGKINLTKLNTFLLNCKKMMGVEINYSIMTVEEFVLRRDTFDRFLKDIFDYRHVVVIDKTQKKKKLLPA